MPEPATPYLRVDLKRLRRNIRDVAERASAAGVAIRPHVKTHKSPEIAQLQLAAGAVGITTATIGEAETFSRHGCADIFIAYPLWLDDVSAQRLRDLLGTTTVTIGLDSAEAAANAGRLLGDQGLRVLVEVDSGQHRTGVSPGDAGRLAELAARCGLDVRGVFTFPGHSYAPDRLVSAAQDESDALSEAAASLRDAGIEPEVAQRWLDAEPRRRGHRGTDRAAARRLRLQRRPAVGARHDITRVDRPGLPIHRRQPRRRPARARRG